jgi:UDP:flavonoid glycosyltransferase YjiC (YdhE family)
MLALATELRRRGHDCRFAVPNVFRQVLDPLGFAVYTTTPDLDPNDKQLIADLMDLRKGSERLLKHVLFPALAQTVAELRAAIADQQTDLLISSDIAYAAPIVAELTGIRWASIVLAPFTFFSQHDPPALPPFPGLAWVEAKVPTVNRGVLPFARWYSRNWIKPVYALRRQLGLPRGRNPIFDAKNSPQLVLGLFSSLLGEPQPDWPPHTQLCGFTFYDGSQPGAEPSAKTARHPEPTGKGLPFSADEPKPHTNNKLSALPPHVEQFLQMGEPPVVFTLGSSAVFAAGDFYQQSAKAAASLGLRAILLTGLLPDGQQRGIISPSLCTAEYVTYGDLFPRAAAIVHQGGVGTLAHALKSGKPMLIVPCSHDQPDNARRAARLGVSRTVPRDKYKAKRAAAELETLLRDPETAPAYAAAAKKAGQHLAEENGTMAACDALEKLASAGSSRHPQPIANSQ